VIQTVTQARMTTLTVTVTVTVAVTLTVMVTVMVMVMVKGAPVASRAPTRPEHGLGPTPATSRASPAESQLLSMADFHLVDGIHARRWHHCTSYRLPPLLLLLPHLLLPLLLLLQ